MSHAFRRSAALLGVVVFVALLGIAGPGSAPLPASAQGTRATNTPIPEGPMPCDPSGRRTVDPRVVEQGGEVEVNVHYNFNCTGEDRKINVMLVVENTTYLGGPRNQALQNVKEGLLRFVNQINYLNGSKGGLILYAGDYTVRVILRDGAEGKQSLLDAIGRISVEPVGSSSGAPAAIRAATGLLPTGAENPEGVTNVLFVVDAGAPVLQPPMLTLQTACNAAHEAGVHVMTVGLENAGYRFAFCATNGWARYDPSPDARGFPTIADELAESLVKGQKAGSAEVFESLSSAIEMLPNAQPFAPDNPFGNDFQWTFTGNPPPSGQDLRYRLKLIDTAIQNEIFSPSFQSDLTLFYNNGQYRTLRLPMDDICVYKTGDPSFCDGFPPPVVETPTPSETPIGVTPSATHTPGSATPTLTDTPDVPTLTPTDTPIVIFKAYLPATVRKAPPGG